MNSVDPLVWVALYFIVMAVIGFAIGRAAERKGRNANAWAAIGTLLPIPAAIFLACLADQKRDSEATVTSA